MRARYLGGEKFMVFDHVEVELPSKGIAFVTGDNGSGKSALIELASVAAYGKTLRGTPWWWEKEHCSAHLGADEVDVTRERTPGGRNSVHVAGGPLYDTGKKGQEALAHLASWEVWKKTSVFSSAAVEGDHFSGGTDGERKRFLEQVLGLDKFDPASKACRKDLDASEYAHDEAMIDQRNFQALMEQADKRAKEGAETLRNYAAPDKPSAERLKEIGQQISALFPDLDQMKDDRKKLQSADRDEYARLHTLTESVKLLAGSNCPTCAQEIPEVLRQRLAKAMEQTREVLEKVQAGANKERGLLDGMIDELEEEVAELQVELRTVQGSTEQYKAALSEKQRLADVVRDATLESTGFLLKRTDCSAAMTRHKREAALLKPVYGVLGLGGVRAQVLAHTLAGLSAVANKWLNKMGSSIRVALSPEKEKAKGGFSQKIEIGIEGVAAGLGYKACSAGQRRRVDVALILGLATMASAIHGVSNGTLFFDEVFDVLDAEGSVGIATALDELARDRCVVLISHSSVLEKHVNPAVHLHVEDGKVV